MEGMIEVSYIVLCANDTNVAVPLSVMIENEKVARARATFSFSIITDSGTATFVSLAHNTM